MILTVLHFGIRLLGKFISHPLRRSTVNRRKILSRISLSQLSINANVRKNYSNLHVNNCIESKCKHESRILRELAVLNKKKKKKSKIPKPIIWPQIKQIKPVSNT